MLDKYFVPRDRALKLKELVFDEVCLKLYVDGELGDSLRPWVYQHSKNKNILCAPLFCQVFDWFREKYNLWNMIYPRDGWNYTIQQIDNIPSVFGESYHNTEMKTYEDAELECLKKLIEIVKKK